MHHLTVEFFLPISIIIYIGSYNASTIFNDTGIRDERIYGVMVTFNSLVSCTNQGTNQGTNQAAEQTNQDDDNSMAAYILRVIEMEMESALYQKKMPILSEKNIIR